MSLEYIDVASGGLWVGCQRGSVGGWVQNVQGGQLPNEAGSCCWSRMSPMTVLSMVIMPVVGLVLLSRPSSFFSCFFRCESALAVKLRFW